MSEANTANETGRQRRYRMLFAAEGILLALAAIALAVVVLVEDAWIRAFLAALLYVMVMPQVVVIPICVFYLVGNPIVMSLRMNATHESLAFRRLLRERPALSDDEFYSRFYYGSDIPKHIVERVRRVLLTLDPLMDRVFPSEYVHFVLDDEIGLEELLFEIEQEFGLHCTEADYRTVDGTLGSLILLIHARITSQPQ